MGADRRIEYPAPMRRTSLEGKLAAALLAVLAVAAAVTAGLVRWLDAAWLGATLAVILLLLPALALARRLARPVAALIRALSGSVVAFRDGDFSFSIGTRRHDEIGDLVRAHNALGEVLRDQRQSLFQRELLLDTVVQNTPTALVLVDAGDHVVYSNVAARHLLNAGRSLNGERFADVLGGVPAVLAQAIADGADGLFALAIDGEDETFHLAQRDFKLQGRAHRLLLLRRMTRELSRQEVATWKKVIRVISHELNNSLAPIRSLSHSARELVRRGEAARLETVFTTIEDRARHLESFIHGYARFAKLPQPRPETVAWEPFLDALARQYPFERVGVLPAAPGWFDPVQVEQVLINLLKNAHEASGSGGAVELGVQRIGAQQRIEVRDRGPGMSETVLANALLPFYSTKRSGSGLGLALAREIAEAHGGRIQLADRADGGLAVIIVLPQQAASVPP
jgi:nitrogen fixation/metabolism regulation signal transduction histidine kinase